MRFNCFKLSGWPLVLVFANILLSASAASAQQASVEEEPLAEQQKAINSTATKAPKMMSDGVIQLEAVIRGNQQQPKVLTIVPWQSPERRNTLPSPVWQQIKQQLRPLERRDFLQEQRLFEKLLKQ